MSPRPGRSNSVAALSVSVSVYSLSRRCLRASYFLVSGGGVEDGHHPGSNFSGEGTSHVVEAGLVGRDVLQPELALCEHEIPPGVGGQKGGQLHCHG